MHLCDSCNNEIRSKVRDNDLCDDFFRHDIFLCEEEEKTLKARLEIVEQAKKQIKIVNEMLAQTTMELQHFVKQTQT
jgi:hypothetical protein